MQHAFGARLRKLRESKKMTQTQIANQLSLTRASISSYENNLATPSVDVVIKTAQLFDVSTDYILGLKERRTIALDMLTARQAAVVENIVDILIQDYQSQQL